MFEKIFNEHMAYFSHLKNVRGLISDAGKELGSAIKKGQKILVCGNGGSAADAQHFAAEIVGRFTKERRAWPAVALTTDSSILSAVANDYGFEEIFARQVEAQGKPGDFLIGLSTSGNSENVVRATRKAQSLRMNTLALLGGNGGALKRTVDKAIIIPGNSTARIQEVHIFILHFWAQLIEDIMTEGNLSHADIS